MDKQIDFQDFIGIFDGFFPEEILDNYIDYFENCSNLGITTNRQNTKRKSLKHHIDDQSVETITGSLYNESLKMNYISNDFLDIFFNQIYPIYSQEFSQLLEMDAHTVYDIKIQKTKPGQGYHSWHCEHGSKITRDRLLAFSLYLNSVETGGETEFLYQKKRIQPIKNRFLIWPAGFTHTHRGNPPLSGEKFIVTGWVELGV